MGIGKGLSLSGKVPFVMERFFRGILFLIGFIFTTAAILCLIAVSPALITYRILKYIHDKIFLPRSCDVLWPRAPFTRSFVWITRQVSIKSITDILTGQPSPPQILCFVPTVLPPIEVKTWNHEKTPLRTHDDLVTYVKEKINRVPYVLQVKVVNGYEDTSLGRTLLAIETHPDSFPLCMTRILSALSQGNVTIEVEPRVFYELNLDPTCRLKKIRRSADTILHWIKMYSYGPLCLLLLPRLNKEKVWRALVAEKRQVSYRRRFSLNGEDSETSQLCIASSCQLKDETTASFSITEISDVDELQKVERLMRATTAELLVSFLAGALRTYFRKSDPPVLHPPNCDVAFTVCRHKSSVCDSCDPCDSLVLPIGLPIGVEGRIPRLWSLQRQFAEFEDRCIPQTLNIFNSLARVLLPRETANKVANVFFHQAIINVSFLRVHGEVMMDNNKLTRFIPIPPLSSPSRASFVFVQHLDKILLVSSIDRGLFDRHTDIFKYMKDEQKGLMEHLSFRLRSLSQTCFLPDRLPSEDVPPVGPLPLEAPNNSPSAEREELLVGPSGVRRQSIAELSQLLEDVQKELDEIRRNPKVADRDETIDRLRGLEKKIESFHVGMKSELWGSIQWDKQEKDEAMKRVTELLAPYKRRVSVGGRRMSRKASDEHDKLRRASDEHDKLRRASEATVSIEEGEEMQMAQARVEEGEGRGEEQ